MQIPRKRCSAPASPLGYPVVIEDVLIREITLADSDAAASLSGELGYPVSPDIIRVRIESLLRKPDHVIFVASLAGNVIGWIDVCVTRHLASEPRVEIGGLVVSPEVRSQGIGSLLVARAEQWAVSQGLTGMLVRSRSTREAAHRFYLREGYSLNKTSAVFTKQLS